jgi:predicted secreted protein
MAKIKSFGARVYFNGVAVGGLTDISASGTDVSMIDSTSHDSAGGYRTFLSGLKDGGTLELTGRYNYADAGQAEWKAEIGVKHNFYIMLSDNSGLAFEAYVGGFSTSNPLDDAVEFSATAKITGIVVPVFPTMTVTGTLTSDGSTSVTFPTLIFAGIDSGSKKIAYSSTGNPAGSGTGYYLYFDETWFLQKVTVSTVDASWDSASTSILPNLATGWTADSPATGTPTVTGS